LIQKHDNLQTGRPSLSLPNVTTRQGRRTKDKNKNNNNKIAAHSSSSSSSLAMPAELQEGRLHTTNNGSGADGGRERAGGRGGGAGNAATVRFLRGEPCYAESVFFLGKQIPTNFFFSKNKIKIFQK
jgi:hypothetical protein